ncbi:hypothetical protein Q1695_008404 [Nippostrongylus brasiliensis]|nr:hypothetical protein Q1695_008404 [Nippostrongylus brasiliensis]
MVLDSGVPPAPVAGGLSPPAKAMKRSRSLDMRRLLAVLVLVPSLVAGGRTPPFDLTRYSDFPEFAEYVREVARLNPSFVVLRHIGYSREHRPLLGVKNVLAGIVARVKAKLAELMMMDWLVADALYSTSTKMSVFTYFTEQVPFSLAVNRKSF